MLSNVSGMTKLLGVVLLAFVLQVGAVPACRPLQRCNLHVSLCDKAYDAVSYPTTHNAMSNFDEGWLGANQEHGISRQLEDGVRALMLDTHYNLGDLTSPDAPTDVALLCHGYCLFGWERLSDGLGKIKAFLDAHPDEVVTIIFETYVTPEDTKAAFDLSGASSLVVPHVPGEPWPTLRQMIAAGQRLVVMTDSGGGTYPWYLPVWSESFDNPYSAKEPSELSCDLNRGDDDNRLFIMNNFLTDIVGRREFADQVNFNPDFLAHVQDCQAAFGQIPNFLTVDFYDRGDVLDIVDTLNGY